MSICMLFQGIDASDEDGKGDVEAKSEGIEHG